MYEKEHQKAYEKLMEEDLSNEELLKLWATAANAFHYFAAERILQERGLLEDNQEPREWKYLRENPLYSRKQTWHNVRTITTWAEMFVIQKVLINERPKRIIELGYGRGGVTLTFAIYAVQEPAEVHCYDNLRQRYHKLLDLAPVHLWQKDLKEDDTILEIKKRIEAPGRVLVYCDNGDKPWEFRMFSNFLKPGDVIMSHDRDSPVARVMGYAPEILLQKEDVEGLEPLCEDLIMQMGGGLYAYRKK